MPRTIICLLLFSLLASGCSRQRYRLRADGDAYSLLHQATCRAPWQQRIFSIDIPPNSRNAAECGCIDDPCLPAPAPRLYGYDLPGLLPRDPARFRVSPDFESINESAVALGRRTLLRLPTGDHDQLLMVSHVATSDERNTVDVALLQEDAGAPISPALVPITNPDVPPDRPKPAIDAKADAEAPAGLPQAAPSSGRRIVPIEKAAWDSIPPGCLVRTLEFESVQNEYELTYGSAPDQSRFDQAVKLSLEDLLELALLNSREYQTQKESLYRAALALSLQRYDYQLKFSPAGNGVVPDFRHQNAVGITENTLAIPSGAAVERVLGTGGNLLASFANSVLLTFNGPTGFATDVGSDLLLDLSQPLLQRDIVFENLTQTERNLVYAARDYTRFRKQFFRDVASDYYSLLLTYRRIEIDMLDYFSNQRGFDQAKNEYALIQKLPRFQVDQFEQNALDSRSSVIGSCNSLEQSFDALKLRIGIPPETPINLDLTELEIISARDEVTVAIELARRARRNLDAEINTRGGSLSQPDTRELIVNAAIQLGQKLEAQLLQQQATDSNVEDERIEAATRLSRLLQVEAAALQAEDNRRKLDLELNAERSAVTNELFFPRMNLVDSLLILGQAQLAAGEEMTEEDLNRLRERYNELSAELTAIYQRLSEPDADELTSEVNVEKRKAELQRVDEISRLAADLLKEVDAVVSTEERLDASILLKQVLDLGKDAEPGSVGGLVPIEIDSDEAMLTALVTRFDLMNERGALADAWRQIKLAGDDLRSVLNLRASQTISTDSTNNEPFDFTFDDSETRLGLTFDAPLNRRAQRNAYRSSLINYNLAVRNLLAAEDQIKFGIRTDLRNLQLDREQYRIAVAGAALASDRRLSTRKQLDEGIGTITARDFLEAQQAYTSALNQVAGAHIDYILDRIDLFLDLELLQVNEQGFWPDLYDENAQPEVRMAPPTGSGPAYGRLPNVRYSPSIRRMNCVPFGQPMNFGDANENAE